MPGPRYWATHGTPSIPHSLLPTRDRSGKRMKKSSKEDESSMSGTNSSGERWSPQRDKVRNVGKENRNPAGLISTRKCRVDVKKYKPTESKFTIVTSTASSSPRILPSPSGIMIPGSSSVELRDITAPSCNKVGGTDGSSPPVVGTGVSSLPILGKGVSSPPVLGTGVSSPPVLGTGVSSPPILGTGVSSLPSKLLSLPDPVCLSTPLPSPNSYEAPAVSGSFSTPVMSASFPDTSPMNISMVPPPESAQVVPLPVLGQDVSIMEVKREDVNLDHEISESFEISEMKPQMKNEKLEKVKKIEKIEKIKEKLEKAKEKLEMAEEKIEKLEKTKGKLEKLLKIKEAQVKNLQEEIQVLKE